MLFGRVLISAVDENGRHQTTELGFGDIWYFPKGQAHTVQGLDDENEYLLAFDDADFDRAGYDVPFVFEVEMLTKLKHHIQP